MSKLFAFLASVKALIDFILAVIRAVKKKKREDKIDKASDESIETRDQRKLEDISGSGSGSPSRTKYRGMLVRKARKRD